MKVQLLIYGIYIYSPSFTIVNKTGGKIGVSRLQYKETGEELEDNELDSMNRYALIKENEQLKLHLASRDWLSKKEIYFGLDFEAYKNEKNPKKGFERFYLPNKSLDIEGITFHTQFQPRMKQKERYCQYTLEVYKKEMIIKPNIEAKCLRPMYFYKN